MNWVALLLLCMPRSAGEEKGTYRLSFAGKPAGTESYRMESFDGGTVVLFSKSAFTAELKGRPVRHTFDTVLTSRADFSPVRYAGYHQAGRKGRLSKLDWKKGLIVVDGKRGVRSDARYVLDEQVVAHYLPILRQDKGKVKAFEPSTLREVIVQIERGGDVMLRGEGREVRAREVRVVAGTVRATAYLGGSGGILRMEFAGSGMLAELEEVEGLVPGPLNPDPAGLAEQKVRFPRGEDGTEGTLIRPRGKGPFPAVVLLGDSPEGADCGGPALELRAMAQHLAQAGLLVLTSDGGAPGAAATWLRSREDVAGVGLIGHGDGGRKAAVEAARNADLKVVVLLSVPIRPLEDVLLQRLGRQLRDQETPEEVRRGILDGQRSLFDDIQAADGDYLVIDERRTYVGALRRRLNFDLLETLRGVEVPVVTITGTADACLDSHDFQRMARELPKVRQVRLEDVGHGFGRPLHKGFLDRLSEIVLDGLK